MVFAIGPQELTAIKAAVERARAHPVPWEVLQARAVADPGPYLRLEDRKPGSRPQAEIVDLPFGYRLNVSFEIQPAGLCQHISISSPDPAHSVPHPAAVAMLAEACGMQWPPGECSRVWLEDFIAGSMVGKAVNVVEVVEVAQ